MLYFGDRLMTNQRKQIIINEITFWKQNKLLPEHYCDFLMTLYTEGEHEKTPVKGNAKKAIAKKPGGLKLHYFVFPVIALLLISAIYVLSSTWFVLIPALVFGVGCMVAAFYYLKKNEMLAPLLQLTSALVLLFATFNMCLKYFPSNDMALYVTLIANCLLWLLSGIFMKLTYFTVAGGLGLLAIVIYSSI